MTEERYRNLAALVRDDKLVDRASLVAALMQAARFAAEHEAYAAFVRVHEYATKQGGKHS
jgi:hypothetical protein